MKLGKYTAMVVAVWLGTGVSMVRAEGTFANDGASLGLKEKRLMKEHVDTSIPDFIKYVEEQCGSKLKVEADWNSFAKDEAALRGVNLYALDKVSGALSEICGDDLGKEGIKKSLKTYRFKNVKADKKKVSFDKGILTLEGGFGAEWGAGAVDQTAIKEAIEEKL